MIRTQSSDKRNDLERFKTEMYSDSKDRPRKGGMNVKYNLL